MRNEYKMIIAGFGAGVVVGILALTSVSASIDAITAVRGDRLGSVTKAPFAYGDIDAAAVASQVELIGPKGSVVEYRDPKGLIVYRADPASNTTVVAKGTIIPSITVRETAGDKAERTLADHAPEVSPAPASVAE